MKKQIKNKITKRDDNYSRWYLDVVKAADLAEHSHVRGCMVIKPHGYAIWENIQKILDQKIKETGHENAYFPLFIPKSFLSKEAEHVKGFAKECVIITHHRLKDEPSGKGLVVDPSAKLEEELIVRPTSETIIYSTFAKWIKSWRDLPVLINQWANVARWEMRTRFFLRTAEFLWQEGHTAHSTEDEAEEEALKMLNVYKELVQDNLAIHAIYGLKSKSETFPGALRTYTIEAMMQDRKALQAGTSHNLGQNFAKAFNIKFIDKDNKEKYAWQTSWGATTRLIGALIMAHSDDQGLVLPPKVAPIQVVIVPIFTNSKVDKEIEKQVIALGKGLSKKFKVKTDIDKDQTPGFKFNKWEAKGVPLRLEIGPKDLEKKQVTAVRRDNGEKQAIELRKVGSFVEKTLEKIQKSLLKRHKEFTKDNTFEAQDFKEFREIIEKKRGFIKAFWCGNEDCETKIKEETKATTRCLERNAKKESGKCVYCRKKADSKWIFAQAY